MEYWEIDEDAEVGGINGSRRGKRIGWIIFVVKINRWVVKIGIIRMEGVLKGLKWILILFNMCWVW